MTQLPYRAVDLSDGLTSNGTDATIKKRNSHSYKSELKEMTKQRDKWRKAFIGACWTIATLIVIMFIWQYV
jgi:hypothetical protein